MTPSWSAVPPDKLVDRLQQEAVLHGVLARLPALRQKLLRLALLEGLTHAQIAEVTHIALGTVKSHIRRAVMIVRQELNRPFILPH